MIDATDIPRIHVPGSGELYVNAHGLLEIAEREGGNSWFRRCRALHRFDVLDRDPYYRRSTFRFLRWLVADLPGGQRWAHLARKTLSRGYHARQERYWDQALPRDVVAWASRQISDRVREYEASCVDNTRVARIGNSSQTRRYRRQLETGCCGFEDWEAVGPDGKRYRLGYNYGH